MKCYGFSGLLKTEINGSFKITSTNVRFKMQTEIFLDDNQLPTVGADF